MVAGSALALLPGFHPSQYDEVSMSPKKDTQKSAKSPTAINKKPKGFTEEERAAMKERAQELKAEARANKDKSDGERDVLAKIAEMQGPDRGMAVRLHAIIKASAPALSPKTWYGMPAYASKARRSSTRGTLRSASATQPTSTKVLCGRPPSR
jgi:uncharacterized protein YdhG (YjbR/CyaY superfamily)